MFQLDLDIVRVYVNGMGQKVFNFGELRNLLAYLLGATDPIVRFGEVTIDDMAPKRILSLSRKSVCRRIRRGTAG
jgi:hypothetical protein